MINGPWNRLKDFVLQVWLAVSSQNLSRAEQRRLKKQLLLLFAQQWAGRVVNGRDSRNVENGDWPCQCVCMKFCCDLCIFVVAVLVALHSPKWGQSCMDELSCFCRDVVFHCFHRDHHVHSVTGGLEYPHESTRSKHRIKKQNKTISYQIPAIWCNMYAFCFCSIPNICFLATILEPGRCPIFTKSSSISPREVMAGVPTRKPLGFMALLGGARLWGMDVATSRLSKWLQHHFGSWRVLLVLPKNQIGLFWHRKTMLWKTPTSYPTLFHHGACLQEWCSCSVQSRLARRQLQLWIRWPLWSASPAAGGGCPCRQTPGWTYLGDVGSL